MNTVINQSRKGIQSMRYSKIRDLGEIIIADEVFVFLEEIFHFKKREIGKPALNSRKLNDFCEEMRSNKSMM